MIKSVLVLMSTYNGEKYVKEQIDSILSQKGCKVELLIRDDGSTDNTLSIIDNYVKEFNNISVYNGSENLGAAKSFIDLLIHCPKLYDYYAFSDQDDVWQDDKLISAISKLSSKKIPALYCCNAILVDKNLNSLHRLEYNFIPNFTFARVLVAGQIQGATMVMNSQLVNEFNNISMPTYIPMHDYFVSLICLAIGGKVVYDSNPYIFYRQHEKNVLGVETTLSGKIKRNIGLILNNNFVDLEKICRELLLQDDFHITDYNKRILNIGSDYKKSFFSKIKLAFIKKMKFGKLNQAIEYRIAILLGRI